MQYFRKIIFYICTAIYIVFCPLIILYALGYIYRPGPGSVVMKTGLIYLSTAPTGATIYLDEKELDQKTPNAIQDVLPGDHTVRIELDGYDSWREQVPVAEAKATVLDKVLLLPSQWKVESIGGGPFSKIDLIPKSGSFLLVEGPAAADIAVFDLNSQKTRPLFAPGAVWSKETVERFFTTEGSTVIVSVLKAAEGKRYIWTDLKATQPAGQDITALVENVPVLMEWVAADGTQIFTYGEGEIAKIDTSAGAVYPGFIPGAKGIGLYNSEIYAIRQNGIFLKTGEGNKTEKVLLDDPALGETLFGDETFFIIKGVSDETMIFLGSGGALLANKLPYRFVSEGVLGAVPGGTGEKVLLWQKKQIGILDFSTENTGNVDFEKAPELTWVYSDGKDIKQCFWVYEGSHILFRDGQEVVLLGLSEYGTVNKSVLFKVQKESDVYYSERQGQLYYLEPSGGKLSTVRLVPEKGLLPAPAKGKVKKELEQQGKTGN
ncbi:MAG: PEGA domain-containing protein [Candidatus Tantalella remota]|nr:PEGA domain-containing protein [Candidatus Tantalella remota]